MSINDNSTFTTHHGNIISLCELLQSYGVTEEEIEHEFGINLSQLRSKNIRISVEQLDQLISLAIDRSQDPLFCLKFADYIHPSTYHALSMSLLSSSTIRSFWLRLERFFSLISTMTQISLHLEQKEPYIEFSYLTTHPKTTEHFHSAVFAAVLIKMIRQIYKPNYHPEKLELIGKAPDDAEQEYQNHFGCEIEYGATTTKIYLQVNTLDKPLPAANVELCRQLDQMVVKYIDSIESATVTKKVKELLETHLASNNFARENIAKLLHMSPRTFHDKLKKEGTSYQQLLDETRQQLAQKYMQEMDIQISELTYMLGFSDASSFSRAFKRWYGVSPSQYEL